MAEKNINDIARPLRELYEKGRAALQRNNLDYALIHFEQVLQKEPGFYECREAMRAAQFKKAGAATGFLKKFIGTASSSPMVAKGQMALRKDPLEALAIAEQVLNSDPNNTGAHKLVAEAAMAADLPRTAILSLEILAKASPRDRQLKLNLAQKYVQVQQADKAETIYKELLQANPADGEVNQAYKNLTARRTMDEGGYEALAEGGGSYRDILKDKNEAVAIEQEHRQVKSDDVAARLIEEYQGRLATEPGNLKLLRQLAELHTQKKQFDLALDYYLKLKQSDAGNDPSLDRAIAETTLRKFDHELEQLEPTAPDLAEKQALVQAARQAFQLEECKQRADRYPTDLGIRYELGVQFFQVGKISEAIGEFQKAQNNPQRRISALCYLAQCFSRRGMNDSAVRMLQSALKEKQTFDDEKKDLIYQLGCVLEKLNKKEEAIEQFKILYESDISYRDVAAKVDAYYSAQGG
jgi:tetratricopeptide (TPR) repeat protein